MRTPLVDGGVRSVAVLLVLAVAVRVALVFLLPPLVDVYYYDSQAVSALASGLDPYGHPYSGIPSWLVTQGAQDVFAYLPGVVLFLAPFGILFDIRAGLIAADIVVALTLLSLGGRRSRVASLVFILAPWAFLFSTSYPNNTLVAMAFLGLYLAAETRGRSLLGSLSLGAALASSQLIWLVFPFTLLRYLRGKRMIYSLVSLLAAVLVVLPFAAWNYPAFVYDTVTFQLARPVQALVTPEPFGLNFNPTLSGLVATLSGLSVPLALKAVIAAAALALLLARTKDLPSLLLNASAFLLVAIFVLADDFSWWYLELPFQTLLSWAALSRGGNRETHANP